MISTHLAAEEVVIDVLAETSIVLIAQRGRITGSGDNKRIGEGTHDAGEEARSYARDSQE